MGISKTNLFDPQQNELADFAKALGHPARIAIIQILLKQNTCINSSLVQELGLAQATISQHLTALKSIGLIQGSIEGTAMSYCINPEKWRQIQEQFAALFEQFNPEIHITCC